MEPMYYIGLDDHKRKISYCVKHGSGKMQSEGSVPATRFDLDHWMKKPPEPWSAAVEATMFNALDLRSPQASCRRGEGGPSADAARYRRRKEKERSY